MKTTNANTRWVVAACFMLLFAFYGVAQNQPRITAGEEVSVIKKQHSPGKAALYSTILPGLGQAYNKKYWKIPIVYAGLGTTIYFIYWNNKYFNLYADAYDLRIAGGSDQFAGIYTTENLITLQNYYRNNRDLSVILTVLIYGLNILDANIDAHLYNFDVSENLSLRIEPTLIGRNMFSGYTPGLHFTLNF